MIARNIATSKKLSKVSAKSALLYTWMIPFLDDYGCFHADNYMIKRLIVPFREDFTLKVIDKSLGELSDAGLVSLYHIDGYFYLEVQQFDKFQSLKTDRQKSAEHPPPPCGYSNWKDEGIQKETKCPNQDEVEVEVEEEGKVTETTPPGFQDDPIDAIGYLSPAYQAWEGWRGVIGGGPGGTAWELRKLAKDIDAAVRESGVRGLKEGPILIADAITELKTREEKKREHIDKPIIYLRGMIFNQLEEDITDELQRKDSRTAGS
jgi:hypothetical protein